MKTIYAPEDLFECVKPGSVVTAPTAPITRTAREYRQWFDQWGKGDWRVKMLTRPDERYHSAVCASWEPGLSWQFREKQWARAIAEANAHYASTRVMAMQIMFSDPRVATKFKLELA